MLEIRTIDFPPDLVFLARTMPSAEPTDSMFALLRRHIARRVSITDEEFNRCAAFFTPRKVRKRQFLLQEGEVCRCISYVTRGCLRIYTVDAKGEEHLIQFAVEDWWASDLQSFLTGEPGTYNIDALEDTQLLMLDRDARERLLEAVPKMERFFRLLIEANHVATNRRIACALGATAEERYLDFTKTYPALVQRIPQKYIASYLGITPNRSAESAGIWPEWTGNPAPLS